MDPLARFGLKVLVSALVIAGVSELGKRFSLAAAILASLPLTSVLAMVWLYWDTGSTARVADLSIGIFWAVLPSLLFFLLLPALLRAGVRFAPAMLVACAGMAVAYAAYAWVLRRLGVAI
jgi:hypothetical protein